MHGDADLDPKRVGAHQAGDGRLGHDKLADFDRLVQHQGVAGGAQRRPLEVQLGLGQPAFGRRHRSLSLAQMGFAQGQLFSHFAGLDRRLKKIPLAPGNNLVAAFEFQLEFGLGQGALLGLNRVGVVARVNPQQDVPRVQQTAFDQPGVLLDHRAADLGLNAEFLMRPHRTKGRNHGPSIFGTNRDDFDNGRAGLLGGFLDLRARGNQRPGSDHSATQNQDGDQNLEEPLCPFGK